MAKHVQSENDILFIILFTIWVAILAVFAMNQYFGYTRICPNMNAAWSTIQPNMPTWTRVSGASDCRLFQVTVCGVMFCPCSRQLGDLTHTHTSKCLQNSAQTTLKSSCHNIAFQQEDKLRLATIRVRWLLGSRELGQKQIKLKKERSRS